ncbi:MAG: hypothetical protein AM1032_000113 [Mycoplasmataceae bacterium]|nr:MAG: hypothetical protein AM1032_000113 [Mycoplasmataceae bacterium]
MASFKIDYYNTYSKKFQNISKICNWWKIKNVKKNLLIINIIFIYNSFIKTIINFNFKNYIKKLLYFNIYYNSIKKERNFSMDRLIIIRNNQTFLKVKELLRNENKSFYQIFRIEDDSDENSELEEKIPLEFECWDESE